MEKLPTPITLLFVFGAYLLPIYLLQNKFVPYRLRSKVHLFGGLLVLLWIFLLKSDPLSLGFRTDNLFSGLPPYSLLTLFSLTSVYLLSKLSRSGHLKEINKYPHFYTGFLLLSFVQEIAYRSLLLQQLFLLTQTSLLAIFLTSLIFAYLHIIYPNQARNLALSFVYSFLISAIYLKFPNIFLATISHAILNFASLYYKLIGPKLKSSLK